jgi:hypothetical protein
MMMLKRGLRPTMAENAALGLVLAVMLGLFVYAIYRAFVLPKGSGTTTTTGSASDAQKVAAAQGYTSMLQAEAAESRANPQGLKNGVPWITSPNMDGFRCVRCSDSGSLDNVIAGDNATLPVMKACSQQKTLQWDRSQAWRNTMTQLGYEIGNYILNEAANPVQGQEFCRNRCGQINNGDGPVKYGRCGAYSYDKVSGKCHYFFNCDEVVADPDFVSEYIGAWNINKQPEVLNFNDKYP